MPSFFTRSNKSATREDRNECTQPAEPIPPSDGPPLLDRYIDYTRYSFASTCLPPSSSSEEEEGKGGYGYINVHTDVVLSLGDVSAVVTDVAKQLEERGLTTPLLFSSQPVDLSRTHVQRLIETYIASLNGGTGYRDALRLCHPREAGWFLRWAVGRAVRLVRDTVVQDGVVRKREKEVRGLVDWVEYVVWRGKERANGYPPRAIDAFFLGLPADLGTLLRTLMDLLTRLTTHSHASGLTPAVLGTLFGPLVFGLTTRGEGSPGVGGCMQTHRAYVRAAGGMEHLLLAWIRGREAGHHPLTGEFPRTLAGWVGGYPSGVVDDETLERGAARRGVRWVRVRRVERNVRSYSRDLVGSAGEWVVGGAWGTEGRVTERHRKRLGMKTALRATDAGDADWGTFEDSGFEDGFVDKLRFDLNEGAKQEVTSKRQTLTWADFAAPTGGFDRTTTALQESLTLAPVRREHIDHWPQEREALRRDLVKGYGELPSFEGYDHATRVMKDEWVEEAFVDVWADLLVSGGWMDAHELTFRKANWVMLEYQDVSPGACVYVFEEYVPLKYQDDLLRPEPKKHGIFKRFRRHSTPATATQTRQEAEFDARLKRHHSTKVITLSKPINVAQIGSPLPVSPQTPRRGDGASGERWPPRSWNAVDSPSAGRGKHHSTSFIERLNMAAPGRVPVGKPETRVMMVTTAGPRFPAGGQTYARGSDDGCIEVLANGAGRHVSAPVVSSVARPLREGRGFRVLSRSSLHDKRAPSALQDLSQDLSAFKLWENVHTLEPTSPSPSLSYCVATKASSNVLPASDDLRIEMQQTPEADITHRSTAPEEPQSELEYLLASPISIQGTALPGPARDLRDDSLNSVGSTYSSDHRAPVHLGKPLPVPPTYQPVPPHRDTVFSVIDGYGAGSETGSSPGGFEKMWYHAAPGEVLRSVPVPAHPARLDEGAQRNSSYSAYSNGREITFDTVDADDCSSTWDLEADHSDETVMDDPTFEGDDVFAESEALEPPPKLEDVEAIARRHSPGRYGHGIPLEFVNEESENETDEDTRGASSVPSRFSRGTRMS